MTDFLKTKKEKNIDKCHLNSMHVSDKSPTAVSIYNLTNVYCLVLREIRGCVFVTLLPLYGICNGYSLTYLCKSESPKK